MSFRLWEVFLSRCLKSYGLSSVRLSVEDILGTEHLSTQRKEKTMKLTRKDRGQSREKKTQTEKSRKKEMPWKIWTKQQTMREEMKRFMFRRKFSYCLSSSASHLSSAWAFNVQVGLENRWSSYMDLSLSDLYDYLGMQVWHFGEKANL